MQQLKLARFTRDINKLCAENKPDRPSQAGFVFGRKQISFQNHNCQFSMYCINYPDEYNDIEY